MILVDFNFFPKPELASCIKLLMFAYYSKIHNEFVTLIATFVYFHAIDVRLSFCSYKNFCHIIIKISFFGACKKTVLIDLPPNVG